MSMELFPTVAPVLRSKSALSAALASCSAQAPASGSGSACLFGTGRTARRTFGGHEHTPRNLPYLILTKKTEKVRSDTRESVIHCWLSSH
ncbi:hypothetical protein SKAU_G00106290 [Synaphobranchus kaupii]|uniref:Uncharacterized protein n=1 Tax=Synaphobranchus kaupii TaxID=118154 RepID=A0A9Q1FZK0_SYNKA|nr:hypothetical protein SKAU_G00106290 [Synaphobranchus kaupii]